MPNLKSLIKRLNETSQKTLEGAISRCLSRTQYTVEIEHWLLELIDQADSDIFLLLEHYQLNADRLRHDLNVSLEQLPSSNNQMPTISRRLIDWIGEAWLLTSLEFGDNEIRSGHLLLALLKDHTLKQVCAGISPILSKLSPDEIQEKFNELLKNSKENIYFEKSISENQNENSDKKNKNLKTPTLDQFTINLNELALQGKLDAAVCREREIALMIDILSRRRQNNPIITGEPGVGKTAVVEGLAIKMVKGEVPAHLKNVTLRTLDMGLLQAGAGVRGEFEKRLKMVIDEVKKSLQPIILFIDEAHTIIGAGAPSGQNDAANLLKPALAKGELRTIAATTWAEYKKYFEQDAALARRFQVVKVDEPDEATACLMLKSLVPALEKHHQIKINEAAIKAAVKLSKRYISGRQLPDKAIGVLDTACARLRTQPAQEDKKENKSENKKVNQKKKEKEISKKHLEVTEELISQIIADWTGIPVGRLVSDEMKSILNLSKKLEQRVIGQDHALNAVSESIRLSRAQLADPKKPIGVFLFAGPSGVGKTETAHALAEQLYGDENNLTVINMSEFKEAHKVSLLMGSPPGYVGYGEGGILTEAVRRKPYSLVLLDEMEKAHVSVQELFYQVFDKGILRDGQGRDVDFKNTVIIMTSNACSDLIEELCSDLKNLPTADQLRKTLQEALTKVFKPAFLGRVKVIPYFPLSNDRLRDITKLQLSYIQDRIFEHHQIQLDYSKSLIDYVVSRCQMAELGARQIQEILNQHLLPKLSVYLLERMVSKQTAKKISVGLDKKDEFVIKAEAGKR